MLSIQIGKCLMGWMQDYLVGWMQDYFIQNMADASSSYIILVTMFVGTHGLHKHDF